MSSRGVTQGKRRTVGTRDEFRCHYCAKPCPLDEGTVDHIWPEGRAGVKANWNLVWSCRPCNLHRRDLLGKCACQTCQDAQVLHGHFDEALTPRQQLTAFHTAWRRTVRRIPRTTPATDPTQGASDE